MYHSWYASNFESTNKTPPFTKVAIFSDVLLVSNYHGCKEEKVKLIPNYMIDIIYNLQNRKVITFEKISNHEKYK